jgi:hypothetical protein
MDFLFGNLDPKGVLGGHDREALSRAVHPSWLPLDIFCPPPPSRTVNGSSTISRRCANELTSVVAPGAE